MVGSSYQSAAMRSWSSLRRSPLESPVVWRVVDLPVMPPVAPMLSKGVGTLDDLPAGAELIFEPKWDGFPVHRVPRRRRSGCSAAATNARSTGTSPSWSRPCSANARPDRRRGEIVVPRRRGLDFDALQQRIHPAESRVRRLAERRGIVHCVRRAGRRRQGPHAEPFVKRRAAWGAGAREGAAARASHSGHDVDRRSA